MGTGQLKGIIRSLVPRTARNWLRSPSRSAEWLRDSVGFSLGITRTLQIAPDWRLKCHPHAYKVILRDQIRDPEQSREFANFRSHCSRDMVFFDVGAHFGIFSLAASKAGGTAIAIDPSPIAVRMIEVQAALNGYTDKIRTVRAAVSSNSGVIALLSSGVFSDGYFKVTARPKKELTEIAALTIDDLTRRYGVPTHIKIDIEGHEAAALRGGRATLTKYSPMLFLELHNAMLRSECGDPDATLSELEQLGYATYGLDGCPIGRKKILEQSIIRVTAKHTNHETGRAELNESHSAQTAPVESTGEPC